MFHCFAVLYVMIPVVALLMVAITVLVPATLVYCMIHKKRLVADTNYTTSLEGPRLTIEPSPCRSEFRYRPTQAGDTYSVRTVALSGDEVYVPVLGEEKDFTVLVVYSCSLPEAERRDILSNLVEKLDGEYWDIRPICCDIVSMDRQPSIWLQREVPKADYVLCVCTDRSLREWKVKSTMFGALKMIIEAKICKDEEYLNFATILLEESTRKYIPDLLQGNQSFVIDDLQSIVRYITGVPLYALPLQNTKL